MSLEDKLGEGFLTKLSRKTRKIILPLTFFSALSAFSCDKDSKNKKIIIYEEPKQESVLTTTQTNKQGNAYFSDYRGEKIPVKVRDSQTKSPIDNVLIEYLDGEDFETFLVQDLDRNYLPAVYVYTPRLKNISGLGEKVLKIFSDQVVYANQIVQEEEKHKADYLGESEESEGDYEHIFELGEKVLKAVINQVIQGEEEHKAIYSWKSEATNDWANYYYIKTISKDEMLEQRTIEYAAFDLAGEIASLRISSALPFKLSDVIKFLDAKKYFRNGEIAERWDIYHIDSGSRSYNGRIIQFVADQFDMIKSNIPMLQLNEPRVEGNKVSFMWQGDDKTTYKLNWLYAQHFPKHDLTVSLGRTKNSDLDYFYKVFKDNVIVKEDSTIDNSVSLNGLENGMYTLEVYVMDEVGNKSNAEKRAFSVFSESGVKKKRGLLAYLKIDNGFNVCIRDIFGDVERLGDEYKIYKSENSLDDLSFSPDGSKLAFVECFDEEGGRSSGQILVLNMKDRDLKKVTPKLYGTSFPSWSPDNKSIAYRVFDSIGSGDIILVDLRDLYIRNLTDTRLVSEDYPSYSPDGERIACNSIVLKELDKAPCYLDIYDIYGNILNHIGVGCSGNNFSKWFSNSLILHNGIFFDAFSGEVFGELCPSSLKWNAWSMAGDKVIYASKLDFYQSNCVYVEDVIDGARCLKEVRNSKEILSGSNYYSPVWFF